MLMQERSEALKASALHTESKQEAAKALNLLGGPSISAQAFEIWGETHIDIDKKIRTPLGEMPLRLDSQKNFSGPRASVSGTWPIFSGGKIQAEQKASAYAVDEARAKGAATSLELDAKLVGSYFGLKLAHSIESLQKAMLAEQEQEVARARKFEAQGLISRLERMGVEVARDAAKREYLKARDNARVARLKLERLLLEQSFARLGTPLFVLNAKLAPMQEWLDLALANNPEIAAIEAKVQQADQGVAASRGNWSPKIFAFGQYSFLREYQTMIEPNWIAGLGINLTLWDARDRLATFRSARASLREARAFKAETVNSIREAVEVAWLSTRNAREQYELTASTVALARENLRLKRASFAEGLCTALDLTNARDQLLKAELGRRLAAYEFVVNFAMLHVLSGRMDDFLTLLNRPKMSIEN